MKGIPPQEVVILIELELSLYVVHEFTRKILIYSLSYFLVSYFPPSPLLAPPPSCMARRGAGTAEEDEEGVGFVSWVATDTRYAMRGGAGLKNEEEEEEVSLSPTPLFPFFYSFQRKFKGEQNRA